MKLSNRTWFIIIAIAGLIFGYLYIVIGSRFLQ